MTKKIKLILFFFGLVALVAGANFVSAQNTDDTFGIETTNNTLSGSLGQANASPIEMAGRVIQVVLSFLALLALALTIYAGFLWMTSNGDKDKIEQAQKILRNALIGLVIILTSWGITSFVISRLFGAVTGNGGSGSNTNNNFSNPGIGAIGACTVSSFYPENNQKDVARNSSIIVSFKEEIKADSVCVNSLNSPCVCGSVEGGKTCSLINPKVIRIFKRDLGDACSNTSCPEINTNVIDVSASISNDKKTLILMPLTYLGNQTDNFLYSVKINDGLKKIDGSSMFKTCSTNYFSWSFEVSSRLDLTPPQIEYGMMFPRPDNQKDVQNEISIAVPARASIAVSSCPNVYSSSTIISVDSIANSPKASASALNYQGKITKFKVVVSQDSKDKVRLFDGNDDLNLLGVADFDDQGFAKFNNFFIFKASERELGNAWMVELSPEKLADFLKINDQAYIFTNGSNGNNNIIVPENCNPVLMAKAIKETLSGDPVIDLNDAIVGSSIDLAAKVAGVKGNDIVIETSNQSAFQIQPFKGGVDRKDLAQVIDKRDVPMNTVIQINFNEPVNPLKVSGLAAEVKDYIKVVNNNSTSSKSGGESCENDLDCDSYKCEGVVNSKKCIGDYVDGRFLVSNNYKTLEFISNNECGVNGCGEKVYCLPKNSVLAVELKSADLRTCENDNDCVALTPFIKCLPAPLGLNYKTCQNSDKKNYPSSGSSLNGIIDMSLNSLDGDRDEASDGPVSFYSDNYVSTNPANINKKDNYRWHFYVNDQMNLTSPSIELVQPAQGDTGVNLANPIKITWNALMMNSTLVTGSAFIDNGKEKVEHKLLGIKSSAENAFGYWISNENIDTADNGPLDGEPDKTITYINHTAFSESITYKAQAGSGIKDIYQNCFKPSAGVGCEVSETNPSCCFGQATSTLGANRSCN